MSVNERGARGNRQVPTARLVAELKGQPYNIMTRKQAAWFGILCAALGIAFVLLEGVARAWR